MQRLERANANLADRQARLDQVIVALRKFISAKIAVFGYQFWDPGGLKSDHVIGPQISAMSEHTSPSPFMFDDEPHECIRIVDLCCRYSSVAKYYPNHKSYKSRSVHIMAIDIEPKHPHFN
jgi:hypothetical protein